MTFSPSNAKCDHTLSSHLRLSPPPDSVNVLEREHFQRLVHGRHTEEDALQLKANIHRDQGANVPQLMQETSTMITESTQYLKAKKKKLTSFLPGCFIEPVLKSW